MTLHPPISLFDARPDLRPARSGGPVVVVGNLHLEDTRISHLPEDLSVGGNLFLRNLPLTQLPARLSVGGYLYLRGTHIMHLPKDACLHGQIFPPECLADVVRFRTTLTKPCRLEYLRGSAHATAATYRQLLPFPDVLRVWQSLPAGNLWIIQTLAPSPDPNSDSSILQHRT